ncbi:hypothetical protein BJ085DRAFT_32710 [Dimargaris cristalligena]|uniref:Uncharacterized protein n=1 Tax=Dimargaris cristalligena TaxID=215637 RepID=A0A4P9ZY44_9FUNG|nr:hypothetical protein BJ085DRAFT_32710 [Dimargaris cristalligena]|eukprot:RKP37971.1 hypothetical protein BJ085DRAFT_32710 [Dimargaris cristalligena]
MTTIQAPARIPYPLKIPHRSSSSATPSQPTSIRSAGVPVHSSKSHSSNSSTDTIVATPPATATPVSVPLSAGPEPHKKFGFAAVASRLTSPAGPRHRRTMSQESFSSQSSYEAGASHTPPTVPQSATPSGEEKKSSSFKERFSMAKLTRKTSVTSSTKSCNDSASLQKKYGVCEKGCIGKGATAVVRLVHHLDRATL